MDQETLKNIIIEGQELVTRIAATPRQVIFEQQARYVFVGIRQAGKSYMLYIRAKQLIEQGHSLDEMLFINFDDERLIGFKASDFDMILQAHAQMFECRPILFLDEIQNVDGWEHFARRLANQKYMVYITGSNAKMLSRDIATTLGARYIEQFTFPYSFREFLSANGISDGARTLYGSSRAKVERLASEYFCWGGFPELNLFKNKRQWLNELYERIILGDILQRNAIRNETAFRLTLKRLAENIKTPTSYNRLANMVKATGASITPTSVSDYIGYCIDACLLFSVENYASKFVERNTVRKHYFIDNGLLNIFLTNSETSLLENLCAITLYRQDKKNGTKFYYYNKEVELDFYLPDTKTGVQSCYSLADAATLEREVKALTVFHRLYGLNKAVIVTWADETVINASGLSISVVPLTKWLLGLPG